MMTVSQDQSFCKSVHQTFIQSFIHSVSQAVVYSVHYLAEDEGVEDDGSVDVIRFKALQTRI